MMLGARMAVAAYSMALWLFVTLAVAVTFSAATVQATNVTVAGCVISEAGVLFSCSARGSMGSTLDLTARGITVILPNAFPKDDTGLAIIMLSSNELTSDGLPGDLFANMPSLTQVRLNNNKLTHLPATLFANSPAVNVLFLEHNDFVTVEAGAIPNPTKLIVLYMHHNPRLAELPSGLLNGFTELSVLYLHDCSLTTVALGCDPCSKLSRLYLQHNRLTTLAGFAPNPTLTNLQLVWAHHNQLTEFPMDTWLGGATSINDIRVHHNLLSSFSGWSMLSSVNEIQALLFHNNQFTSGFATFIDGIIGHDVHRATLHGNSFDGEPGITRTTLNTKRDILVTVDDTGTAAASSLPACEVSRRPPQAGDPGSAHNGDWMVLSNCSRLALTGSSFRPLYADLDAIDDNVVQSEPLLSRAIQLDAEGNRLRTIPNLVGTKIIIVRLPYNLISRIPSGWLDGLAVTTVSLVGNPLQTIEPGFCTGVETTLTGIQMQESGLVTLPAGVFEGCSKVTYLNMQSSPRLERLEVGSLRGLSSVTSLRLYSCPRLREFDPQVLADTPRLSELLMYKTGLARVARPFPSLPNLRTVAWYETRIAALPSGTFRLVSSFTNAQLFDTLLPESLEDECAVGYMEEDDKLGIFFCVDMPFYCSKDAETDSILVQCKDMPAGTTSINLSNYKLKGIASDAFATLGGTVAIDLSRNDLTAIPPPSAFGVNPADGTRAAGAPQLIGLNLASNNIASIPKDALKGMTIAGALDLSDNGLSELQAGAMAGLVATVLDLRNNALTQLTFAAVNGMAVREELRLTGNPLAFVEEQVVGIGPAHVTAVTADVLPCPALTRGLADWRGAQVCTVCIKGHYCPAGQDTPQPCPAGRYNVIPGGASVDACKPCSAGSFSDTPGATTASACTFCPVGTSSPAEGANSSLACIKCSPGTFAPSTGLGACLGCPEGTYNDQHGAFSDQACKRCPAGTAHNTRAAPSLATCAQCQRGWFAAERGSSECRACPKGSYAASPGSDTCQLCPENTYNDGTGATALSGCQPCPESAPIAPEGSQSALSCSAVATLACSAGQYAVSLTNGSSTTTSCVDCPAGHACAGGSASASLCPQGSYSPAGGADACLQCARGKYGLPVAGATSEVASCATCPAGLVGPKAGASACIPCPYGTASGTVGATSMDACTACNGAGSSSNSASTCTHNATVCAAGMSSPLGIQAYTMLAAAAGGDAALWALLNASAVAAASPGAAAAQAATASTLVNRLQPGRGSFQEYGLRAGEEPGDAASASQSAASSVGQEEEEEDGSTIKLGGGPGSMLPASMPLYQFIIAASLAFILLACLLGHRALPNFARKFDLMPYEHMRKPGDPVIHQPTRLGTACSLLFLGLGGLTAYSLATTPNQSYSTSIVSTLTMGNNIASSDILVTIQGLGVTHPNDCMVQGSASSSSAASTSGVSGVAVTMDGMVSMLAAGATPDPAFPYPDGTSLLYDNATQSCTVRFACRRCTVAGKASVVASVPWNWQLMTWSTSTRSERASGEMVGAIAAPNFLAPQGATVSLSVLPTFLVVESSDGVPSHLETPDGVLAAASSTASTSGANGDSSVHGSGSDGSRVASSGHVLTFRSGSVHSVPQEQAEVQGAATTSVTVEMEVADVADRTVVTDAQTAEQRAAAILSAVMSMLAFVGIVYKTVETALDRTGIAKMERDGPYLPADTHTKAAGGMLAVKAVSAFNHVGQAHRAGNHSPSRQAPGPGRGARQAQHRRAGGIASALVRAARRRAPRPQPAPQALPTVRRHVTPLKAPRFQEPSPRQVDEEDSYDGTAADNGYGQDAVVHGNPMYHGSV